MKHILCICIFIANLHVFRSSIANMPRDHIEIISSLWNDNTSHIHSFIYKSVYKCNCMHVYKSYMTSIDFGFIKYDCKIVSKFRRLFTGRNHMKFADSMPTERIAVYCALDRSVNLINKYTLLFWRENLMLVDKVRCSVWNCLPKKCDFFFIISQIKIVQ